MRSDEHRYFLGKHEGGECWLTWTLKDGRFSMCGEYWMPSKRDCISCGQNVDEVAGYFPNDAKAQRMLAIWERWHLNDLKEGSKAQEDYLRAHPLDPKSYAYPKNHYTVASEYLAAAGLNPDADGYKYGHAWKTEELPADVLAEIESWSAGGAP